MTLVMAKKLGDPADRLPISALAVTRPAQRQMVQCMTGLTADCTHLLDVDVEKVTLHSLMLTLPQAQIDALKLL